MTTLSLKVDGGVHLIVPAKPYVSMYNIRRGNEPDMVLNQWIVMSH